MPTKKTLKPQASQEFVPIKEIRDGVVVLKNNSLRMVIMASSLNFALKSSEEQEGIILQYQNFLNSLDFTVQIFIQSRGLNIEPYLETLRKKNREQTDELLKIQTREYVEFVKEFVSTTNIVSKNFYLVIPYDTPILESGEGNFINSLLSKLFKKQGADSKNERQDKFEEYKIQLQQRADTVTQGLSRTGVKTIPLNTEELIELFYNLYNPGEAEQTKLPEYQK